MIKLPVATAQVIYVTRSVIPFLAKRGITGLTIGSNPADFPPQVPKLHRWVDRATGTPLLRVALSLEDLELSTAMICIIISIGVCCSQPTLAPM
jgi:hypothetical protein